MTFHDCLHCVLRHEGGFVHHPRDPGGMTNLGVTRRTWEDWTGASVTEHDMRTLTQADVVPLYRSRYWNEVNAGSLPAGVNLCVFDFAVNAGPARAAKLLQKVLGVLVDGKIGPRTIAAANAANQADLVRQYQNARRAYYRSLSTFGTFGKGWLRRVDQVETEALRMIP